MPLTRRSLLYSFAATPIVSAARSQEPLFRRAVSLVVPLQAGTASDLVARVLGDKISPALGQPVVIENIVGGGGALGAQRVARSEPDGHVLGAFNNGVQTILPHFSGARLQFDPEKDLLPISLVARFPSLLIVNKELPAQSLADLVRLAKGAPGKLTYASVGQGSPQHLAMEELKALTGMDLTHVPYRGGAQATTAVVAGEVNAFWIATSVALSFIQSQQVRAVATGERHRTKLLPDVPMVRESGIAYEYSPWLALYAPARTPKAIVDRLATEVSLAVRDPAVRNSLGVQGLEAQSSTQAELRNLVAEESGRMATLIRKLGLQP